MLRSLGSLVALALLVWCGNAIAESPATPQIEGTHSFPGTAEVLGGRTFANEFEREVYFLKRIREAYPSSWAPLLEANILVNEYVVAPTKLQKFVEELGEATRGTDDRVAIANLSRIISQPDFYANTNTFRPEILRAAAIALIKIGPHGRQALAGAFDERHYRGNPESLEALAGLVGELGVDDSKLISAIEAMAFKFATAKGGNFPNCTQKAVSALLRLPGGVDLVRQHLKESDVFDDPGRFQDVVRAISSANANGLRADLIRLEHAVRSKIELLKTSAADPASAAPYLEELSKLDAELNRAVGQLKNS